MSEPLTTLTIQIATRKPKRCQWAPLDSITTHELAKAIPLIVYMCSGPTTDWEFFIPPDLRKHFKIIDT